MLTRQHYKAIAAIVKDDSVTGHSGEYDDSTTCIDTITIAHSLADYFAEDNPCFDRAKFLTACGL